jgi:hypothetical protein
MPIFEAFSSEVEQVLLALRSGERVSDSAPAAIQVQQALKRFEETIADGAGAEEDSRSKDLRRRYHRPGPKSALFARLLAGKDPLPYPPPTSFSYPWYELIEQPGPHLINTVGGVASLVAILNGDMGTGCDRHLLLNQCIWGIEHANGPAEELLAIQEEFTKNAGPEPALAPFWDRVRDAYSAGPVFIVRYGRWEPFRMQLGRLTTTARRDHAERSVSLGGRMESMFGPLDVSGLDLNAKVGAIQSHFNLANHLQRRRLARLPTSAGDSVLAEAERRDDELAIAAYRANPSAYDFVGFEIDAWTLTRA